jgi:hypothetical protein
VPQARALSSRLIVILGRLTGSVGSGTRRLVRLDVIRALLLRREILRDNRVRRLNTRTRRLGPSS